MDSCSIVRMYDKVVLAWQDRQRSKAITMGKNSRTDMWWDNHFEENSPKIHLLPKMSPKPTFLASVNGWKEEDEWTIFDGKRAFLLKFSKHKCKAFKEALYDDIMADIRSKRHFWPEMIRFFYRQFTIHR